MFFSLGLFYRRTLLLFLILITVFVFGNGFSNLYYKYGLYAYDFYFFSFIVMFFYNSVIKREFVYSTSLSFPIIMLIVYALVSAIFYDLDKHFVRDFRLLVFLLECFVIYQISRMDFRVDTRKVILVVILASVSNLFFWSLSSFGSIGYSDVYYNDNRFRYFDLSTYIASVYIIFSPLFLSKLTLGKVDVVSLFLAVLCVLVSGSRMIILVTLVFFVFHYVSNIKNLFLSLLFLIFMVSVFSISGMNGDLLERISDLSLEVVGHHLEIRYSPFFSLIENFDLINFVFGSGFGTTFFIPWFEYRSDNLIPVNNFIDTTYLTLFAKFGLFSFIFIYFYIRLAVSILSSNGGLKTKTCLSVYLLCLMFVYAIPFQSSSIGIFIGLYLVFIRLREIRIMENNRMSIRSEAISL